MTEGHRERRLPPASDAPLLSWLLKSLHPMSRTRVKQHLRDGQVTVNGTPITQFDYALQPGDCVCLVSGTKDRARRELEQTGIVVVHQDTDIIVIDKPPGLLSVATAGERTNTAFAELNAYLKVRREGRPFVVHRLDRETSGLLLFARSESIRDRLQANWEQVSKTYLAIVEGKLVPSAGVVEDYLWEGRDLKVRSSAHPRPGAKRAVSHYRVVAERTGFSLVEIELKTGRKHQIRVHMSGRGSPVIGDRSYGARSDPARRLGLHAWRLAFDHPTTGQRIELESSLPTVLGSIVS